MKGKQTVKNQRAVLQAKTLKNTSNDGVKFSPQRAFVRRRNLEVKIPNLPWSSPRTRCQKPRLQGRKRQQLFLTFRGRKSRCHAVSRLTVRIQAALKLQRQLVGVVAADPRFVRALEKEGIYSEATAFLFCYQLCFRSSHLWMKNDETTRAPLTCSQDELAVLGHLDGGGHSWHFKVLDELNPALDVCKGTFCFCFLNCHDVILSQFTILWDFTQNIFIEFSHNQPKSSAHKVYIQSARLLWHLKHIKINLPTSFFCSCLFFRSDSHCNDG